MNTIICRALLTCYLLSLLACGGRQWGEGGLEQQVLSRAKACSEELYSFYREEIERQREILSPDELENSLKNMLDDINCAEGRSRFR